MRIVSEFRVRDAVLLFISFCFFLPSHALAEEVVDFDATLTLDRSGDLKVVEMITYDFGELSKHGIFRYIPSEFTDAGGEKHHLTIEVTEIVDGYGSPYTWTTKREDGRYHVRIGDPDIIISGAHTYVLTYTVRDAVSFLVDRDELYWNVTGNDWDVPIRKATAHVSVPLAEGAEIIDEACYEGALGEAHACAPIEFLKDAGDFAFHASGTLAAGEGMTVAVGFSKDLIAENPFGKLLRLFFWYFDIALGIFIPLLTLMYAFRTWQKKGKDPKGRGTVVVEYSPAEDITVLEAALLYRNTIRPSDISAAILGLATKRAIRIEHTKETSFLFFSKDNYTLAREHSLRNLLVVDDSLLDILFDANVGAKDGRLELKEVKPNAFLDKIKDLKKLAGAELAKKGYFSQNPYTSYGWLPWAAIIIPVLGVVESVIMGPGFILAGAILAGIICGGFAYLMPQRTEKGAEARDRLIGLKRYISVAEKDRIEFHNAPEKSPTLFETLLPYAMLFGVTDIWLKQFADIMVQPPNWYQGASGTQFSVADLSRDIGGMSSAVTSIATPSSSGSGGGGSSGGGGGGGGGGSW